MLFFAEVMVAEEVWFLEVLISLFFFHLINLLSFFLFVLNQVRVFTFSVGQHNYDVTPLQWIACANKGKETFSRIYVLR